MTQDATLTIRLPQSTLERLRKIAREDDRSVAAVVRRAVKRAAEGQDKPPVDLK